MPANGPAPLPTETNTLSRAANAVIIALRKPDTAGASTSPHRRTATQPRVREYLTQDEIERLMTAARSVGRHGHRDATLILIGYRHGLRVSELIALRWDQLDLKAGTLHVARLKNGRPSVHPVRGPERC